MEKTGDNNKAEKQLRGMINMTADASIKQDHYSLAFYFYQTYLLLKTLWYTFTQESS